MRINASTEKISRGPLEFDVTMARSLGWTETEINVAYTDMERTVTHFQKQVMTRHPELYRDGMFIGKAGA